MIRKRCKISDRVKTRTLQVDYRAQGAGNGETAMGRLSDFLHTSFDMEQTLLPYFPSISTLTERALYAASSFRSFFRLFPLSFSHSIRITLLTLKANECIREAKHILGYTFSIHLDFSYLCANPLARIR